MKILFCANQFQNRIVGPAVLAEMLMTINDCYPQHEIRILTEDVAQDSEKIYKFTTHYPRLLQAFDFIMRNRSYQKRIKNIYKTYSFDIILFSNARFGILTSLFLPPSPKGVPRTVKTIKVMGFINDYFSLNTSWRTFQLEKMWFFYFFTRQFERFATQRFDLTMACSQYVAALLKKEYHCPDAKIAVLYQTSDLHTICFKPKTKPFTAPYKILFVKSHIQTGGLDILCKALTILKDYTFELTLIGASQRFEGEIKSLIQAMPHVQTHIMGSCSKEMVYAQMYAHDILCMPSRTESLGIANIEGLAAGISVVSTHEGGITEVLNNGENGWLATPENPASLAEALKNCLLAPPSVRMQKSENGRRYVEQYFDPTQLVKQFIDICENRLNTAH